MVRRYADVVEVRPAVGPPAGGGAPSTFLWQGRLYVVREILGHWRERSAWWTAPAAQAVHGQDVDPADPQEPGGGPWAPRPRPDMRPGAGGGGDGVRGVPEHWTHEPATDGNGVAGLPSQHGSPLLEEREVWRVEASRGMAFGSGVYDLCRPVPAAAPAPGHPQAPAAAGGAWQLLRVAD